MEKLKFYSICILMLLAFVWSSNVSAQSEQEKMMAGVWKFNGYTNAEGEKFDGGKNFSAVKIYNPDGEYCFAQFYIYSDGTVDVKPHDYGTWSYKNGQYMECGRKGEIISLTRKEFRGKWNGLEDSWLRVERLPEKFTTYIMSMCRILDTRSDIKEIILRDIFNRKKGTPNYIKEKK
ncbi:MAG: hypothetical protein K6E52_05740 [Bacteroidaceae bacterium]|nr:hypothetical protein [Bacteroidaceae bacterium]